MRRTTTLALGLTSAVALGAAWVSGLAPTQPASNGAHVDLAPTGTARVVAGAPGPRGPSTPTSGPSSGPASNTASNTASGAASATAARAKTPATPQRSGVATGALVDTQYGAVQVRVTFVGKHITDVRAAHLTDSSGTSVSISNYAAPILRQEAVAAQSAQIDMVSGATYTSMAYQQSLQSAIDAAHLA